MPVGRFQMLLVSFCVHLDCVGFTLDSECYRTFGPMNLAKDFLCLSLKISDLANLLG